MATKAFFIATDIGQPDVATGFWARTGCLGPDKGPLVSRQGFPKVGLSLLR